MNIPFNKSNRDHMRLKRKSTIKYKKITSTKKSFDYLKLSFWTAPNTFLNIGSSSFSDISVVQRE